MALHFRHNIGYGDLSAKEEDVIQAAELAELHDSILDWPKGYDTQVNEFSVQNLTNMRRLARGDSSSLAGRSRE